MAGKINSQRGFVLITTMLMLAVLLSLLSAYFFTTNIEIGTSRMSRESVNGFYAAEGGLNVRAETIRQTFVGFNRPAGVSPTPAAACEGANQGSGDYICRTFTFGKQTDKTYITEDPTNPVIITIPPGERYQNLNAQEYRYTAFSQAADLQKTTAMLELKFKSRLVPLFQFAAFYNKDLEILPGPTMTLNGPVHTNGDLYLNTDNSSPGLTIQGQVTTAGDLYRGRKNDSSCMSNPVKIYDPLTARTLIPSCPSRTMVNAAQIAPFNNMIQTRVASVEVPAPEVLDPTPGQVYWSHADLRLVLRLNSSGNPDSSGGAVTGVEARNADDTVDAVGTTKLNTDLVNCPGSISGRAIGTTNTLYNNREAKLVRMLDVDLLALLDCLKRTNWFNTGKLISDSTDGGLVFHLTVKGPHSANAANEYGVRVRNGQEIKSAVSGAPLVKGITFVSDQAVYVQGDFNTVNKKPAAFLADAVNILSNAWLDSNSYSGGAPRAISFRTASNTTVNSAFLAGTDTTGGIEGAGGQGGAYNGGLENYPRFHENWSGQTFTYRGSFVSLNRPRHQNGAWVYGGNYYTAPNRVWSYETAFNNAANLPPITPRFVYLRQELFVRDFER